MLRKLTEGIARKTTRRRFFGRGAEVAFGALAGAAAGSLTRGADAAGFTVCAFPGPPCTCDTCFANGVCAKPCVILTFFYTSGCWVTFSGKEDEDITCCDCDCAGTGGGIGWCGCASDFHNNPEFCPNGNATS